MTIKAKVGTVKTAKEWLSGLRSKWAIVGGSLMLEELDKTVGAWNVHFVDLGDDYYFEYDCDRGHFYATTDGAAIFEYAITKDGVYKNYYWSGDSVRTEYIDDPKEIEFNATFLEVA